MLSFQESPLHVQWAEAGEHYGVRADGFWEPVNFRMRRHPAEALNRALETW
jgi:hypothetical protein